MILRAFRTIPAERLARDERGVALLEFAFVLPFLVLLFIGGFQLMDAISAYRKVGNTVRTLADLTTQNTVISDTQADEILNASRQVMAPYSPASAALRITQVQTDSSSRATVSWTRDLNDNGNDTARRAGASFTLPSTLSGPNKYYVFSEMRYTYTPRIASSMIGAIPLSQTIYMSPRNSSFITYN